MEIFVVKSVYFPKDHLLTRDSPGTVRCTVKSNIHLRRHSSSYVTKYCKPNGFWKLSFNFSMFRKRRKDFEIFCFLLDFRHEVLNY